MLHRHACIVTAVSLVLPGLSSEMTKDPRLVAVGEDADLVFNRTSVSPYGFAGQWLLRMHDQRERMNIEDSATNTIVRFDSLTRVTKPHFVSLKCAESQEDFKRVQPYITNSFRKAVFHKRTCGKRKLVCGRMVLDNAIDDDVLKDVHEMRNRLHMWEGLEVVKGLMEKHFNTGDLVPVGGQLDHNIRSDLPCEMHTDYLSRPPQYFLTAIIYLVDQGRDCWHCETIFNDSVERGRLLKGHIVQPRRGRVVLFSGGIENMHCKMPSDGRRDVVQLWFQCASENKSRVDL